MLLLWIECICMILPRAKMPLEIL